MITLILAAGQGKRMNSGTIPKVLVEVYHPQTKTKRPMLIHILLVAELLPNNKIVIVVNDQNHQAIRQAVEEYNWYCPIEYIVQDGYPGTGGAIRACLPYMTRQYTTGKEERVLILSGDVPLISLDTLLELTEQGNALLYTELLNPTGNGRIIFWDNYIEKIVEEKDCTDQERAIKYVNCGIYTFHLLDVLAYIIEITDQNQSQEFYLTDLIGILWNHQHAVKGIELPAERRYEIINVNTPADLKRIFGNDEN